jgi:hypothetical protein
MLSAIGPIAVTYNHLEWAGDINFGIPPIETDAGILVFDNTVQATTKGTFAATVVPEPSTLALAALGAVALLAARRRNLLMFVPPIRAR